MRNYPAFPRATPHRWAGSPRVPHPSATLISEETTFDLHALGTPPALILSQDQTLHQYCLPAHPKARPDFVSHCACVVSRYAALPPHPKACTSTDASVLHLRPPTRHPANSPRLQPLPRKEASHPCTLSRISGVQPVNVRRCHQSANKRKPPNMGGQRLASTHLRLGTDRRRRSTKRHPPVTRSRPIRRVSAVADGG